MSYTTQQREKSAQEIISVYKFPETWMVCQQNKNKIE